MEEMIIRTMKAGDAEAVSRLFAQCFADPWSYAAVREMFTTEGYCNLIAFRGEEICGYVGIKAVLDEADIVNVAVSPVCRRQGIGRKLIHALLEVAKEKNIAHIFLEVREHNEAAIGLYEEAGFSRIGIRKNYYTNPKEHAILMVWE